MFKRILSALRGKKNSAHAAVSEHANEAEPAAANDEPIVAYDAYGREMHITRDEWHDKIFLPTLQQKWDNAGELYNAILSGLNDGFAANLIPAAERLVEIDDIPERSHVILGIVLMKNGRLDDAERALRAGIEKSGATGTLLTNLAKVFAERGEDARADETLWQAMQADPNQDNGLLWWAAIQQEREGEAGYLTALRTVAALPGSWRAQLWLARHHLEHKDVGAARALYAEVLTGGMFDDSALMMISGDLGNNGQIPLIVELVAPVYDEHRHDPMTGINVLRAYQELGNAEEGEKLLARMYSLGFAPIKQHLDGFAQVFQEMRNQAEQGIPTDPDKLKISTLALTQPIWHYGLRKADWLFKQKPESAPKIGFFALSKIADGAQRSESQREDDLGRLTRAIPLYLAEAAHYWSEHATNCYISVVEGVGPVVSAGEVDGNALFDIVPPGMTYFVTGEIGCTGEDDRRQWQISLSLWNCASRTKQASESGNAIHSELGDLVLNLEQRLLAHVGLTREQPLDAFYLRPSVEAMPIYLTALGQAFMLTLAANKRISRSSMWGERAMLDWPLNMALHWPQAEVPKLMYLSGLGKAFDYQSDALAEYKERSLGLLREAEGANSAATRLAPLIWKIFAMHEEFNAHRQSLPADSSSAYLAWLARVAEK
ncbi:tetratricopeptide repeat protein [Brenneria goodwinii]|uniref:tetratricopeptide repeat protein n=1 Tax=Brenneria goodwinii TaxID=1109412 RepID=UPI000EF18AE1|nr:tetratricopeptide repeat protein [Brenneria goodwinii]MCG8156752.1 tetratricopeptide repeat protein [Brenneria goodwinii]MCG8160232.1 tetratricopeptide repeat protein [Brenneria goodwinii]MCG8164755.1 tetratricopeptide repeat protein [Brenneria goodwinii]MCG8171585.1 tetratricopeptide repeat protein [Brenneria goodwinii]MCG8174067.1 tetratricopeptide repeat protein [Brenneria goodwinii]